VTINTHVTHVWRIADVALTVSAIAAATAPAAAAAAAALVVAVVSSYSSVHQHAVRLTLLHALVVYVHVTLSVDFSGALSSENL